MAPASNSRIPLVPRDPEQWTTPDALTRSP
jgi:hypothetical protein